MNSDPSGHMFRGITHQPPTASPPRNLFRAKIQTQQRQMDEFMKGNTIQAGDKAPKRTEIQTTSAQKGASQRVGNRSTGADTTSKTGGASEVERTEARLDEIYKQHSERVINEQILMSRKLAKYSSSEWKKISNEERGSRFEETSRPHVEKKVKSVRRPEEKTGKRGLFGFSNSQKEGWT